MNSSNFKTFLPIVIIIIISLLSSEIDFSNLTAIYMTSNSIIIFGLIPFLMLVVSFSHDYSNLVVIREGKIKIYLRNFSNYCASFMIFVIYIGSIMLSNNYKVNVLSLIMYMFQVIIIYLTIFNIAFILHMKKIFKHYSILYGIIITSIFIYLSYSFISLMLYFAITLLFIVGLMTTIIIFIKG